MNVFWTTDRVEKLSKMREIGMTNTQIAKVLDTTESSVKTAFTRYVNGRRPQVEDEMLRSRSRKAQNSEWIANNREAVNARRRALRASRKSDGGA